MITAWERARELIAVEAVNKTYGAGAHAFTALTDVSFTVREVSGVI